MTPAAAFWSAADAAADDDAEMMEAGPMMELSCVRGGDPTPPTAPRDEGPSAPAPASASNDAPPPDPDPAPPPPDPPPPPNSEDPPPMPRGPRILSDPTRTSLMKGTKTWLDSSSKLKQEKKKTAMRHVVQAFFFDTFLSMDL